MPGPRPLPHIELPEWLLELMGLGGDDEPDKPEPVEPVEPEPPPPPPSAPVPPPLAGQEEVFGLPVDPVAVAAARLVGDILNGSDIFGPDGEAATSATVITVLTHPHPDGTITITVGVSGHPDGARNAEAVLRADPRFPAGARIGPADVVLPGTVDTKPCAEVRAALEAQRPDDNGTVPPPPTGMGTVARDPNGRTAERFADPANPGTLCPCGTCAARGPILRPLLGVPPAPAPGG